MKESDRYAEEKRLYLLYVDDVFRLCFYYLGNRQDAEDAVSETVIRLLEKQPAFESDEHARYWLLKVAGNVCRKQLRSWWKKKRGMMDDTAIAETVSPEDLIEQTERREGMSGLLLTLNRKYRLPLYLYYYAGFSQKEIAVLLGEREGTIRVWLHRGKHALRKLMEEDTEESVSAITGKES